MKRTPLKRKSPLRRTRLPSYRPKGTIPIQLRWDVRERDQDRCRKCNRWAPDGDVHHTLLRSQGGKDTLENCILLCRDCHSWAHANPKDATAEGLIRSYQKTP